ncbi:MAG: ABC transporter permease [Clostridiaceae bacterium]
MIAAECKKALIKQRGIVIIFVMILLKVVLTLSNGYDSHYIINQNPGGYSFYINQYKGRLTGEKEKEIKAEYYAVGYAAAELEELSRQWQEGKIDRIRYESLSKKYYEMQKNRSVFNVVYNQYYYAADAPDDRYIMDGRGWSTLLSHDKPDFPLLLCLIIVLTPLFCVEYESGMDALLLSSVKGKYKTGTDKLLTGIFLAVCITALFSVIEFTCINNMAGLKDGGFPLQSLEFFQNSEYHLSLNRAFLTVVLLRILGAMLLAACISITGVFSGKSIITLFSGSVLTFLPYIFFKGNSLLYCLPLPSGLLSGVGYLWGTSYISTIDQYGNAASMIQFQKIGKAALGFLIIGYCMEISILLICCLKKYSGYTCKHKSAGKIKMISCACIMLICSIIFTGCDMKEENEGHFTVNTLKSLNYGETDIYRVNFDITKRNITAENKKTGETIELIREPFEQDAEINAIFVHNEQCCYLSRIPQVEGIRIFGINMRDMGQKLIFNNIKENSENFFGILSQEKDAMSDFEEKIKTSLLVFCFFINKDYIYYGVNSQLIQINRTTGRETAVVLDVAEGRPLFYHNGDVYYVDKQHRLSVFREEDGKAHTVDSVYTDEFTINGNFIEYYDLLDRSKHIISI